MRAPSFVFLILLAGSLAACSESHGVDAGVRPDGFPTEECFGAAPTCYDEVSALPGCCTVPSGEPSFCVLGSWECPRGQRVETRCTVITPTGACVIDAGVGPPPYWGGCDVSSDCTLAANTCCGVCGMPTASDVDGVNASRLDQHYDEVCPIPQPCPDCPSALNPELVATCESGVCAVLDIHTADLSACTSADECVVRVPDCCECGADTSSYRLIAMRADRVGAYTARVCDPGTGCLACEPIYPAEATAICGTDGRCQVAFVSP